MEECIYAFVRDYYGLKEDDWLIERFVNYDEDFPKDKIEAILSAKKPLEMFEGIEMDSITSEDFYYESDFWRKFEAFCTERFFNFNIAKECVEENFQFCYPKSFFNPTFNATIRINAGDLGYDYACHNVLNYCANDNATLSPSSGLYWLATQQGQLDLLEKAIAECNGKEGEPSYESKFVKSSIEALENLPTSTAALTFNVKMKLQDAISILQAIKDGEGCFKKYSPQLTEGCPLGHLTLGKDVACTLYDADYGSGALTDIELDADVKIPIHYIHDIALGDAYNNVYGLRDCYWKDVVKEVCIARDVAS